MPISRIMVSNFKGISSKKTIDIKPITIFIGANSSGKSSCIHALACLSQTIKVSNNNLPLILDDEFANVHLGRFIEVIHSKSYQDLISLGICVGHNNQFELNAEYSFKCTKRTQDIILQGN
jgi:predicted ATPase